MSIHLMMGLLEALAKAIAIPSALPAALGITGFPGYLITMDYALQYTFGLTWLLWCEDEAKK